MMRQRLARLLCGLPLIAGMLLLAATLQQGIEATAAADWNTTSGVVEVGMSPAKLGLYTNLTGQVNVNERIDYFRYRYSVDGQSYTSHRVGFGAIEWPADYHKGDKVVVYYDPHHPTNSALATGIGLEQLISYTVAFGLMGVAAALWRRLMSAHENTSQRFPG